MKKYAFVTGLLAAILVICLLLTGAYVKKQEKTVPEGDFLVVTSFYPMYIAAMNLTEGVEGLQLENLSEPQTGCLHDFQLTPEDMKLLSGADLFLVNGGGIESFLTEVAEAYPGLTILEACGDLQLLKEESLGEEEENAHAWMSIPAYRQIIETMSRGLALADPAHADLYEKNRRTYDSKLATLQEQQEGLASLLKGTKIISFHEAYAYVAEDYGLEIVSTMDLDEERQVSAGEVAQVLSAIDEEGVDLILAEELYGSGMGQTILQEREVSVLYLDPLTRGEYEADAYLEGMEANQLLLQEYAGKRIQ